MDIKLEKYELLDWLISIEDEEIISRLKSIFILQRKLSEIEDVFIDAGLKDLEEGRTFSHDNVLKEIREIYGL